MEKSTPTDEWKNVPQLYNINQKLKEIPPLYYINLDRRPDRNDNIKVISNIMEITPHRVKATDYQTDNLSELVVTRPSRLTLQELACTISHLSAIQQWYNTSDSETALICEDDLSIESVVLWPFTWTEFEQSLPNYWDIVQLCIIYDPRYQMTVNLHRRSMFDYSATCYLIKRSYAKKLLSMYWVEEEKRWNIDDIPLSLPMTSEETIYNPGVCLSIPLFTYTNNHGSDIQTPEHLHEIHKKSKEYVLDALQRITPQFRIEAIYPPIIYKL